MKRIVYHISCMLMLQLTTCFSFGQDIFLSAADYSELTVNPALAGCNSDLQANVNYRSQWKRFGGSYSTMMASFDKAFRNNIAKDKSYLAAGLDFYSDNTGVAKFTTTSVKTSLAYHLQISPYEKVSVGIYLGYLGFSTNLSDARWGSQYDGIQYDGAINSGENLVTSQKSNVDVGFGAVWSSKMDYKQSSPTFQLGISAFHLNRPSLSFYDSKESRLPVRVSSSLQMNFPIGKKNELKPSIYFQVQNKFVYILMGSMYGLKLGKDKNTESVSAGLFYRSSGAIIARASYQKMKWNIGLTYEINGANKSGVSGFRSASEICLRYSIPSK